MYSYENILGDGPSTGRKRPRPMSRPVSKNFNRISDFIFPDTVHVRLPELPSSSAPLIPRYRRIENYNWPVFNRHSLDQHDLIVVERLPTAELVQRRGSLQDRIRDRRKRHTTDNAYHSLLKSMNEDDDGPWATNKEGKRRYPPSYRTTIDTDITERRPADTEHTQCTNDFHTTLFIDEDVPDPSGKAQVHKRDTLTDATKCVRPYFLIRPQTALLLPNETGKFKCCFGGEPLPTIVWSHNGSRIPELLPVSGGEAMSTRYRTHKLHDIHYLDIGPITEADHGQIKCSIANRFGREEVMVKLLVVPTPADGIPSITQPLVDITIHEGEPLKLSCGIEGLQVTVTWFHNSKLITSIDETKSDYRGEHATFHLGNVRSGKDDAGTVDCLVKNRFGEARSSCRIDVTHDPVLDR